MASSSRLLSACAPSLSSRSRGRSCAGSSRMTTGSASATEPAAAYFVTVDTDGTSLPARSAIVFAFGGTHRAAGGGSARPALKQAHAELPQHPVQQHQRQAHDGEIVADDALHKQRALALEAVRAGFVLGLAGGPRPVDP